MADIFYAHEKLGRAAQVLATHPGRIKERLIAAFNEAIPMVSAEALPDEPRRIWKTRVWEPLTRVKDERRGSAAASLDDVSEEQACTIAESILTVDSMVDLEVESRHR